MSQTYQARRRAQTAPAERQFHTSVPGPSMAELAAGAMPSTEQMGRRVDLPDAIREKMEASFGADFSGVKLYESQTVADAGANAMTMGSNVAFAPGQLDLTSTSGQALLGHELSHVVSQARGESAGRGFLADSDLEAQADRQGMLAAQGESAYTGPVAPLSASAVPASAGGVAQAKKKKTIAEEALDGGGEEKSADAAQAVYGRYASERNMDVSNVSFPILKMGFRNYVEDKLASMAGDKEQQDAFLDIVLSGDKERINGYVGDDMRRMTESLGTYQQDLVSEDFETRANAYTRARADNQNRRNLIGLMAIPNSSLDDLDEELVDNFRSASNSFGRDYSFAEDSLMSAAGRGSAYKSRRRKAFRANRRSGKDAFES